MYRKDPLFFGIFKTYPAGNSVGLYLAPFAVNVGNVDLGFVGKPADLLIVRGRAASDIETVGGLDAVSSGDILLSEVSAVVAAVVYTLRPLYKQ